LIEKKEPITLVAYSFAKRTFLIFFKEPGWESHSFYPHCRTKRPSLAIHKTRKCFAWNRSKMVGWKVSTMKNLAESVGELTPNND